MFCYCYVNLITLDQQCDITSLMGIMMTLPRQNVSVFSMLLKVNRYFAFTVTVMTFTNNYHILMSFWGSIAGETYHHTKLLSS